MPQKLWTRYAQLQAQLRDSTNGREQSKAEKALAEELEKLSAINLAHPMQRESV